MLLQTLVFQIVYYLSDGGMWPLHSHILSVQGEEKRKHNKVFVAVR